MNQPVANHSQEGEGKKIKNDILAAKKKMISGILGGLDTNVRKVSIEMIVITVMTVMGMNPLQTQIADLANLQNAGSEGQNDVTNLGAFLSYIESEVKGYDTKKKKGLGGELGSGFWSKNNQTKLSTFIANFKKYYEGDKANGTFSKFQFYFPGMSKTQNQALTKMLLSKFWANIQKGKGNVGSYINGTGKGNISDIQMYMLMKIQYELDKKYADNKTPIALYKIYKGLAGNVMSKLYNPKHDPVVETGANGLWGDLGVGISTLDGNTTGGPTRRTFTNFRNDLLNANGSLSTVEHDLDTIASQYYENNNPGSTSKTSTSTSSKPNGSMVANIYNGTSTAQSLSNTQNQQNTQKVQQTNSELTSDDKTAQSIITNFSQSIGVMTNNQKST